MEKSILKTIGKCVIFGIIWGIVLFGVALIITNFKDYELRDVLFVEGIIFVVGGVLSSIGGNPMGLSMQGLGQNNAQYIANANLEVSKMEKDKTNNIKTTISAGLSTVSLIIGGLLVIAINFII
ncbi:MULTISPECIES: hypothetical protein [Clostridium]|jgi:hypothetical protein|uniref:hypothetical protein n=1 Tax=Clostridium TaxID=1485 RepID=UPI0006C550FF|nr:MULTISPECIES: hypothetical protein [Clostridium]MDU2289172.1 hypothetical protein [Clostridium celatum]MBX9139061.1 hypothetical protein [Clostridium sp. K12(2020)]MBX9146069.1 hypothetical protein [Clostridium sp. K13]MDU3520759.1 hypothetical protein [Clostridium saudiense]MDU4324924.1 hypothetical protein [Clostridium celatum]